VDVPFEPPDRIVDPQVLDELRIRRIGGRDRPDPEVDRLRAALAESDARVAELQEALSATRTRLAERVQEVSSLAAHRALVERLEAELDRERDARRHAEELLAGERDRFARVLAASQLELRDELDRTRAESRAALDAAHGEGVALREQLAAAAAELDRVAGESRAAAVERAALEQELRAAQAALEERAGADDLRAELAARSAAQERALAELSAVAGERPPATALAPSVPPADHPALGNVPDHRAVPDSVIADLARAAERLRELAAREEAVPEGAVEEPAAAVTAEPAPAAEPEATTTPAAEAEPAPTAAPAAAPTAAPGAGAAPEPAPAPLQPLLPPLAERPTFIAWLAPALAELAREDAAAANRLLLDLLPVQGLAARRPLSYELALEHGGVHRVHVARGRASVERDVAPGGHVPVRIRGSAAALAPLVGGGRARPQAVQVAGRRWKLRRLLRDLRAPVGLPELARAGVRPAPADLLALLAASVRPDRTRGTSAVVLYVLDRTPQAAVVVADGVPLVVLPDPGEISATAEVHAPQDALLPLLAGTGEGQGRGDLRAVERLHRWLRAAQGLDA
jgi:hypothetical protein